MNGKWHCAPYYDFKEKKWLVTFEVEVTPSIYEKTKDKPLNIEIKRQIRSLNANAYFHVLVDKIANELGATHFEVHNKMIAEYGQIDTEMNCIIMRDSIPWTSLDSLHLRPTTNTSVLDDGELYRVYQVMRGSHTYDTKEMAALIDGVVLEAKSLGIETASPEELERMKQQWKVS